MVVILILPSSEQTPPPSSSINGCDQFRLNGARIINNNHEYRNRTSTPKRIKFQIDTINHRSSPQTGATYTTTASATTATASKNCVRHVTRVNISDVFSQIEIDGDVEPVTKEGKTFHTICIRLFFPVNSPIQLSKLTFDFRYYTTYLVPMTWLNLAYVN